MSKQKRHNRKSPARSPGSKLPAILRERTRQEQTILAVWIAQLCLDILTGVLNDPDIMGKDVFGAKRLKKICNAFNERFPDYIKALSSDEEADYVRTKID